MDSQREKRLEQEQLRKVKTLGAASEDVDDLGAWVTKSRALEEKVKAEARAKALKQARMLEEQVSFSFTLSAVQGLLSLLLPWTSEFPLIVRLLFGLSIRRVVVLKE